MRAAAFVLFFSTVLAVYGLINSYIFLRGWQSIPEGSTLRNSCATTFVLLALSFFAGRIMERLWNSAVSDLLVWTGSFWIAAMLYFSLTRSCLACRGPCTPHPCRLRRVSR
jgi:uncharacterized protein